ncbi:MarR family winged helix-turn-helix transcriptional regulator [Guptibacillus algicola]|uniref:MarR family winged helix-turn-helix transcriptional regulator n=1 Tax=Guptibacillus algicola TaxID=225844 RepID=UPI001CD64B43|nr:MarR family transcriptional regulator [Alkalihalobacillus algicola]MCA0986261.1 MarR family transcriptional regulator [Alkalihalobacillus algicola]
MHEELTKAPASIVDIEKSLRMVAGIIKQHGRELLGEFSLTPPQFLALQWLSDNGDLTIGELSNKMYLACSTTTDLVDRMEKTELVKRVKDPHDRRVVRIHILEKGHDIIRKVIQKRQAYLEEKTKDFSEHQMKALEESLALLYSEMETK